jgi:serum/glucocorticoid-regulated kinase 2
MDNPEIDNPLEQFNTLCVIGKGSYAKVVLVRKKSTGMLYALKSMKKKYIELKKQ